MVSLLLILLVVLVAGPSSTQAAALCQDVFAPHRASFHSAHRVGAVLMSDVDGVSKEIYEHIVRATPDGVELKRYDKLRSMWVRDWHPLIRKDVVNGGLEFVSFRPTSAYSEAAAIELATVLKQFGMKERQFPIFLDWGNVFLTDKEVFISNSLSVAFNDHELGLSHQSVQSTIETALGRKVVWLPELPNEGTGHLDIFVSELGRNRFMVSDSREPQRKAALDRTAQILEKHGYEVHRVMNAYLDRRKTPLTYTNALVLGDRVLVPVYGTYARLGSLRETAWRWAVRMKLFLARKKALTKLEELEQIRKSVVADDENAIRAYEKLGFEVYPIPMNEIVDCGGMVHCLTHTMPKEIMELIPAEFWESQKKGRP